MITPEPPAGSEHYREGWRHGYEQAAIDRERSADAVQAPDVAELRCDQCGRSSADWYRDLAAPVVFFVRPGLCHPCSRSTALPDVVPSGDTVASPDVADLLTRCDVEDWSTGEFGWIQTTEIRALLCTDTTPDRLAWISEAGETAAAERQARYQETACARRPAEERPDA